MSGVVPPSGLPLSAPPGGQDASTPTVQAFPENSFPKPLSVSQPAGYTTFGRRSHKKSRTGCSTCKARKIKCDERHPACLNCISHGVQCPFLRAGEAVSSSTRPFKASPRSPARLASTPTQNPSPTTMSISEGSPLPLLELELLHNFTTKTYATLTADSCLWEFWRDDVVQLGLREDYIMRAVLAVSALHLAYHRPDRRDFYVEEGILLHQKASRSAMRVMAAADKIDKDQAATLFVFSMLTMFFALASPRRSNPDGTFFIGESGFPDWPFLLSGSKSIMEVLGQEAGLDTVAGPFLKYGQRRWHAQRALLARISSNSPGSNDINNGYNNSKDHERNDDGKNISREDRGFHNQQQGSPTTSSLSPPPPPPQPLLGPLRARIEEASASADPALRRTYAHALDELELALVGARADPGAPRDVLDAMVWLWVVSDEFVPLLRAPTRTQEAVAIFAHFGLLLRHHESHWWLQGWGDHVIARAGEILDDHHRAWIEWPLSELRSRRTADGGSQAILQGS